jgi:hypothetical protein
MSYTPQYLSVTGRTERVALQERFGRISCPTAILRIAASPYRGGADD